MTQAVIYDLDGTLVDTLATTYDFFQQLCKQRRRKFRMNGVLIESLADFRVNWQPKVSDNYVAIGYAWPKNRDKVDHLFLAHRKANPPRATPGMRGLVRKLNGEGIKQGVVTSSPKSLAGQALSRSRITKKIFEAIVADDGTKEPKPSPEYLLHCLELMGVEPRQAVYVGDTPADINAARAAGVVSIAMRWEHSFSCFSKLLSARPNHSVTDANDLERTLNRAFREFGQNS